MGFLSGLFKSKERISVETHLGTFTQVSNKKGVFVWKGTHNNLEIYLMGSATHPKESQLTFVTELDQKLAGLETSITETMHKIFNLDEKERFGSWKERLEITKLSIVSLEEDNQNWGITLKDQTPPYSKFLISIKNNIVIGYSVEL